MTSPIVWTQTATTTAIDGYFRWPTWSTATTTTMVVTYEPDTFRVHGVHVFPATQPAVNIRGTTHPFIQAQQRARELLRSVLDEENRRRLDAHRPLRIIGSAGGIYEIDPTKFAGNLIQLNAANMEVGRFCVHIPNRDDERRPIPSEDNAVAQILALTTDEAEYIAMANV